jgi:hypothetical protein
LNEVFDAFNSDRTGPAYDDMEAFLEEHNLFGVLHVFEKERGNTVGSEVLHSERPGAPERRWLAAPIDPAEGSFIVLNDLPGPQDDATRRLVQLTLDSYRARGMTLLNGAESGDMDVEASVRSVIPTGAVEDDLAKPAVHAALARHKLAGLVRIAASRGEGSIAERVVFQIVPTSSEIARMIEHAPDGANAVAELDGPTDALSVPVPPTPPTTATSPGSSSAATWEGSPVMFVRLGHAFAGLRLACGD